jgi:hypothetical protein
LISSVSSGREKFLSASLAFGASNLRFHSATQLQIPRFVQDDNSKSWWIRGRRIPKK